jgi:hypothetical protein
MKDKHVPRRHRVVLSIAIAAVVPLAAAGFQNEVQAAARAKPSAAVSQSNATPAAPAATTDAAKPAPPANAADAGKTPTSSETAKKAPDKWADSEVAEAKARCAVVLKRIHAVAIPHEPIKEGACGAPAPIELVSIGRNPEVALSPPAIVRCDLAEALVTWLEGDLQPLARKHLGSQIVRIETMSSYSCRNAYGRKSTKLSEHALADALDIGDFTMASAQTASVLDDWGTPQREVLARIAAEKAAAEKRAAEQATANKAAQKNLASGGGSAANPAPPAATASTIGAPAAGIARSTIIDGLPKLTVTLPGATPDTAPGSATSFSIAEPDRLGGPLPRPAAPDSQRPYKLSTIAMQAGNAANHEERVRAFLHEAHAAACRIFGTTLGPEANAFHRNHFHVDMAPRKFKKICD